MTQYRGGSSGKIYIRRWWWPFWVYGMNAAAWEVRSDE